MHISTLEMEIALGAYFDPRSKTVVPNVSWGLGIHECDLLVVSKARYATEVEIKISKADLVKDKDKKHGHKSDLLRYLYFAIPEKLLPHIEHIPARAGILVVKRVPTRRRFGRRKRMLKNPTEDTTLVVSEHRAPITNTDARKLTEAEHGKVVRLGSLRLWNLKRKEVKHKAEIKALKKQLKDMEAFHSVN